MNTTVGDLDENGSYDLLVHLQDVNEPATANRAYELALEDIDGTAFELIVWDTATAAEDYDWHPGEWYHLGGVTAKEWDSGTVLHGTAKLTIEPARAPTTTPTEVLYLTDSHLGKTTHGWSDTQWSVTPADGFQAAIEMAIDKDVAAVVHGGDLFHNPGSGIDEEDIATARRGLHALNEAAIPFYFIYGNHERQAGRRVMGNFCDNELATHLEYRHTDIDSKFALYGIDHNREYAATKMNLESPPANHQTVVFLHQSVAPFTASSHPETTLAAVAADADVAFDLVVTGHTHTRNEQTVAGQRGLAGGATAYLGDTKSALTPSAELLRAEDGELTVTRLQL